MDYKRIMLYNALTHACMSVMNECVGVYMLCSDFVHTTAG